MTKTSPLYTTFIDRGAIPEVLDGAKCRAYLTPEEALHRGGLWRKSTPNRLLRIRPIEDPGEHTSGNDQKEPQKQFEVIGLSGIDAPLHTLSTAFGNFTEEMYTEQSNWRRALMRPLNDPEMVESCLNETLFSRGLTFWNLKRFDSSEQLLNSCSFEAMYAWGILYAQTAFEAWRDASVEDSFFDASIRVGWSTWFSSTYWDDIEYAANPEPNATIDWVSWDAWAALSLYFTSKVKLVDFPCDLLTKHYRSAYRYGMEMALPIDHGTLGYTLFTKK